MRRHGLVLASCLLVVTLGARADERRDAIQKVFGDFKASVVTVAFHVRMGDQADSQVQQQRIPGVLVDKNGLVMVSSLYFPEQVPVSRLSDFRVVTSLGPVAEGYPARFLGRGRNPLLAFVRVTDPKRLPDVAAMAFDEDPVQLGDELLMVFPSDRREKPSFALGMCNMEIDSPVQGWGMTATAAPGCPALTLDGKAVGVVAGRQDGQQIQTYILGAKEILPSVRNPPSAPSAASAQAFSQPAWARGWLGLVYLEEIGGKDMAEEFGLPADTGGIIVGALIDDSPADKAGLQVGDVILSFLDADLRNAKGRAAFHARAQGVAVGVKVPVVVWRDGHEVPLTITTVPVPKLAAQAERRVLSGFGLVVREIVLDDRFAMRLTKEETGVLCESVAPATRAADAGLNPGDIIKKLNEEEVHDIRDFKRVFRRLSEERPDEIFLRVLRGGRDTLVCRMEPRWESLPVESGEE